ncbi:hypothetical protein HPP92_007813 [Vanilla planifolia]|uniref:Lysosomal Pro-X carboxypeptidase n=1 Tax=Vanilla planifolia TaxID=51239 RepID=A0A835RN62_VANPL|nr:hypothetical protein HPP92_007813 [Vanilla planifolia]
MKSSSFLLPLLSLLSLLCPSLGTKPIFLRRFPSQAHGSLRPSADGHVSSSRGWETKYYTQTLDHFNYHPISYVTFQQKYLINAEHWGGAAASAPIFVYTGNEGPIEIFAKNTGLMFDIAPKYYGTSIPFGSGAEENATTAGYLSTSLVLADFATLIVDLKRNLTAQKSPVVVFGGSYGGMLAAWFRLKYPEVAIGALASSAPILQIDPNFNPFVFTSIITNNFKSTSENCYRVIKNSWDEIDRAVASNTGKEKMEKSLKLCTGGAESAKDWIDGALTLVSMTDYPTPSNFLQPLPAYPVKQMCNAIDNPTTGNDTFAKLYGAMNIYYNYTGAAGECFNTSVSATERIDSDAWSWQTCTEIFLPTGANNNESMFQPSTGTNLEWMTELCYYYYYVKPRFFWLTTEFGASSIKTALKKFGSNIIFYNGLKDPWSGGGVLKSISKTLVAIVAPKGAHHVDLRASTRDDPKWLQDLRTSEVQIIKKWIRQYYRDNSISSSI